MGRGVWVPAQGRDDGRVCCLIRFSKNQTRHCEELLRRSNPFFLLCGAMDCFAALAMTEEAPLHTHPSSPAKAGDPVRCGFSVLSSASLAYWIVRRSLSSGGHSADPVAAMTTEYVFAFSRRIAPEVCKYFCDLWKSEGAGNAGCALHPRSHAQKVVD